jgi:hypothetical protein
MADDEIERLLREIDATGGAQPPAKRPDAAPAPAPQVDSGGGRLVFAGSSAVVMGGATFVGALLTPFTDNFWMAAGAAVGAFVTGLVAGPPRWFRL